MRSGVGAAWPFTFLLFLLLELFSVVALVDFFVVELFVAEFLDVWVALAPEVLLCEGFFVCVVVSWALCAETADTVNVPAASAARINMPRFFLQSSKGIAERMSPAICCPPEPRLGETQS